MCMVCVLLEWALVELCRVDVDKSRSETHLHFAGATRSGRLDVREERELHDVEVGPAS